MIAFTVHEKNPRKQKFKIIIYIYIVFETIKFQKEESVYELC